MSAPSRKAAAICYRLDDATGAVEFLLVWNREGTRRVFPKGTVEDWEAFGHQAAAREAWEEAGARGAVDPRRLGTFPHLARLKRSGGWEIQQIGAWLLRVADTAGTPEPGREAAWFSAAEARRVLLAGEKLQPSESGAAGMLELARERLGGAGYFPDPPPSGRSADEVA